MLLSLHVRNFVLVREAELEFGGGFCVLTGETGAGKSMLVDALQLVCGRRDSRDVPVPEGSRAELSAEFDAAAVPGAPEWLRAHALDDAGDPGRATLRRVIDGGRRSRCFVNGSPATLGQVRELGALLIDIHGQHESLRLLEPAYQRDLLDGHAGALGVRAELAGLHARRAGLERRLAERSAGEEERERRREELARDLGELSAIGFSAGKWEDVDARARRAHRLSELREGHAELSALLDGEGGALSLLERSRRIAESLGRADPGAAPLAEQAGQLAGMADEFSREVGRSAERVVEDADDLAQMEAFLSESHRLMGRHRCVTAGALDGRMREMEAELAGLGGGEGQEDLSAEIAQVGKRMGRLAGELTRKRKAAAGKASRSVTGMLRDLGMPDGEFAVGLEPREEVAADGREKVGFLISTRKGMPPGDIAKVASGGELSRLGLAIMACMAGASGRQSLVFDEVDAGIGGDIATMVGRALLGLSGRCGQVLCVTHLPQIASLGDEHWRVAAGRGPKDSPVLAERLGEEGRREEVARMLGGDEVRETAVLHAERMLGARGKAGRPSRRKAAEAPAEA